MGEDRGGYTPRTRWTVLNALADAHLDDRGTVGLRQQLNATSSGTYIRRLCTFEDGRNHWSASHARSSLELYGLYYSITMVYNAFDKTRATRKTQ